MNGINYNKYIIPYKNNFIIMQINMERIEKIKEFAMQLAQVKELEHMNTGDNYGEYKRQYTGLLGESAIEGYLDIGIIDWSIGKSERYNYPDIPGYNLGIKTVEYDFETEKFPIIYKHNTYPQIINLKMSENIVCICGIATPEVLNEYQNTNLILSKRLKSKGNKTAFYGFEKLIPFNKENVDIYKRIKKST